MQVSCQIRQLVSRPDGGICEDFLETCSWIFAIVIKLVSLLIYVVFVSSCVGIRMIVLVSLRSTALFIGLTMSAGACSLLTSALVLGRLSNVRHSLFRLSSTLIRQGIYTQVPSILAEGPSGQLLIRAHLVVFWSSGSVLDCAGFCSHCLSANLLCLYRLTTVCSRPCLLSSGHVGWCWFLTRWILMQVSSFTYRSLYRCLFRGFPDLWATVTSVSRVTPRLGGTGLRKIAECARTSICRISRRTFQSAHICMIIPASVIASIATVGDVCRCVVSHCRSLLLDSSGLEGSSTFATAQTIIAFHRQLLVKLLSAWLHLAAQVRWAQLMQSCFGWRHTSSFKFVATFDSSHFVHLRERAVCLHLRSQFSLCWCSWCSELVNGTFYMQPLRLLEIRAALFGSDSQVLCAVCTCILIYRNVHVRRSMYQLSSIAVGGRFVRR